MQRIKTCTLYFGYKQFEHSLGQEIIENSKVIKKQIYAGNSSAL